MPKLHRGMDAEEMAELYLDGWTLQAIGDLAGVSRERVRQMLPEDVKKKAKEQRRRKHVDEITRLIKKGLTCEEIGDELGLSNLGEALQRTGLDTLYKEYELERRKRRTRLNGPCRVCNDYVSDHWNAVTCSPWCREAWVLLRRTLDEEERRAHRMATTRWSLRTGYGTSTRERKVRVLASDGEVDNPKEGWFIEGSATLACAAECVRRGYQPVIDALSKKQMRQVREYLDKNS